MRIPLIFIKSQHNFNRNLLSLPRDQYIASEINCKNYYYYDEENMKTFHFPAFCYLLCFYFTIVLIRFSVAIFDIR